MTAIKSFVSTLNASSADLSKQVSVLDVMLCAGVEQILSRGRSTCETLKGSIDSALSTLINDQRCQRPPAPR
jgi:hypothetical protein